jgi:group I intron endonuclease
MGWIYRIISPNGKSYIGQTISRNVGTRWSREKSNPHGLLRRAFKKYGLENFIFEELMEITEASHGPRWQEYLDFWEKNCIQEFNSLRPHGYNSTTGGKNCKFHDASRERMRQAQLAKPPPSEETRQRMREAAAKRKDSGYTISEFTRALLSACKSGENHHMYGKTHKQESKDAISKRLKGRKMNPDSVKKSAESRRGRKTSLEENERKMKSVEQWSNDGKILINTFKSVSEAAQSIGIGITALSSCLNGRNKTSAGFVWKFTET